ncbi:hypothetical protein Ae201684P_003518 [Aphanomyces euteiches]|nr:hypothetical protein Ae201684P_003518 [Aphanomyces euteiches]
MKRGYHERSALEACHGTTKRRRDKSFPVDALSWLMWSSRKQVLQVPAPQTIQCFHCERTIRACGRECMECLQIFCDECSTINYDRTDDRVFCLSCNVNA